MLLRDPLAAIELEPSVTEEYDDEVPVVRAFAERLLRRMGDGEIGFPGAGRTNADRGVAQDMEHGFREVQRSGGDGEARHALAMHGDPKYAADFEHFDYVDPNAPPGGRLRLAALGSFDSLNPYIIHGVAAKGHRLTFESLMARSMDEPFSLYGLLARGVEMAPDRTWVVFDSAGTFKGSFEAPEGLEPYLVDKGKIWGVFTDALDVESVRAYELTR